MTNLAKLTILFVVFFSACVSQDKITGDYSYKTECLGSNLDGSITLKAWGTGSNKAEAVDQAVKNVLNNVLFDGIYEGKPDCPKRPIMLQVNAHEKHENYFNSFFAENGSYKNFGLLTHKGIKKFNGQEKKRGSQQITYGVIVVVQRSKLIQKLKSDGIILTKN